MYLIQSSSLPYENQVQTLDAIEELGIPVEDFGIIPFNEEIHGVRESYGEPVILLGSCKSVRLAPNYPQLNPGVFFNEENFKVQKWVEMLGDEMLNKDIIETTIGDLVDGFDGDLFIRPETDLKLFAGMTVNHKEFVEWFGNNETRGEVKSAYPVSKESKVVASSPKNIIGEWRCFIVNGKIISGSQYRNVGYTNHHESFPQEVQDYAENVLKTWVPHDVCVADVAKLRDNSFRIIEFNCFNASGWYKSDQKKILKAVHDYVMESNNV